MFTASQIIIESSQCEFLDQATALRILTLVESRMLESLRKDHSELCAKLIKKNVSIFKFIQSITRDEGDRAGSFFDAIDEAINYSVDNIVESNIERFFDCYDLDAVFEDESLKS